MKETILGILPFNAACLFFLPKQIFPTYHLVSDEDVLHVKHLYKYKTVKAFENDLELLVKNYKMISLEEYTSLCRYPSKRKRPICMLSFDDGMREVYDVIYPILQARGIPATFFLNSAFLNNRNLFYRHKASLLIERLVKLDKVMSHRQRKMLNSEINLLSIKHGRGEIHVSLTNFLLSIPYKNAALLDELGNLLEMDFNDYLRDKKPYMDNEQVKTLINNGFDIGSHSVDHPLYSELSTDEQVYQTLTCMTELETMFNINRRAFAFPFNDRGVSKEFFDLINMKVEQTFGTDGFKKDEIIYNIQRFCLDEEPAKNRIIKQGIKYLIDYIRGVNQIRR